MKYYTSTTEYNCGIDLHARQMYVCVMNRQGKKLVHTNVLNNDFSYFLKLVEPCKYDLTVCCECITGRTARSNFDSPARFARFSPTRRSGLVKATMTSPQKAGIAHPSATAS